MKTEVAAGRMNGVCLWIYASGSESDAAEWQRRFERHRSESGSDLEIRTLDAESEDASSSSGPSQNRSFSVLWDASVGVPPKEIDGLVRGCSVSGWCAGVRSADPREARGLKRLNALGMKWFGRMRKWSGRVSDVRPPCLALPHSEFDRRRAALRPLSKDRWIGELLRAALREGVRVTEAPLMWSVGLRRKR